MLQSGSPRTGPRLQGSWHPIRVCWHRLFIKWGLLWLLQIKFGDSTREMGHATSSVARFRRSDRGALTCPRTTTRGSCSSASNSSEGGSGCSPRVWSFFWCCWQETWWRRINENEEKKNWRGAESWVARVLGGLLIWDVGLVWKGVRDATRKTCRADLTE